MSFPVYGRVACFRHGLFLVTFVYLLSVATSDSNCGSRAAAHACLATARDNVTAILEGRDLTLSPLAQHSSVCLTYYNFVSCVGPNLDGCGPLQVAPYVIFGKFLKNFCSPSGFRDFLRFSPCLRDIQHNTSPCSISLSTQPRITGGCQVSINYKSCLVYSPLRLCSVQDGTIFKYDVPGECVLYNTLTTTTTTTTAAPAPAPPSTPPYTCYECSSGAAGDWQNTACPANGNVTGWARGQVIKCNGPCMTSVRRHPLGEVVRGCSSGYYWGVAVPRRGCLTHRDDVICFCSGDRCNDRDMTVEQQKLLQMHGK
ncbi:uncharacterized protein LOC131938239 [Physella acuta]|uniref:uncharacterized protein LOC131938239 n=1 Tax=Physella acuta TaxID=109671 RepID=UPI0027DB480C|nr:uncharacterized protein LOC131938239 [Physella acuta]